MLKSLKNRAEGFTLVELLVVIVIIGILAAIAIPVFLNQSAKANMASAQADVNSVAKLLQADIAQNGATLTTSTGLSSYSNTFGSVKTATTSLTVKVVDASNWCVSSDVGGQVAKYSATGGLSTGAC